SKNGVSALADAIQFYRGLEGGGVAEVALDHDRAAETAGRHHLAQHVLAVEYLTEQLRQRILGERDDRVWVVGLHVGEEGGIHAAVNAGLEQQRGEAF